MAYAFSATTILKEVENPCKASSLDHTIEVQDKNFTTELFDKRDALPFYINRMPYLDSNIPSKIFYASIGSEVLRITRTTMGLINMVKRKSKLQVHVPVSFHY